MIRDQERYRLFTRRAVLLGGGQLALVSALTARMYYLQVVESERYRTLAEDNRINLRLLAPPRGRILDRNGVEIAANQQNYRLIIVAERSPDVDQTLERVARLIELGDHDRRRVLREARRKRGFVPITIRENLDWEEVARLEIHAPDLPGVHIEVGQTRHYPYDVAAAHLLGYVGAVAPRELTGDPLLELPSFRIGKNGIEKVHDLRLRGRAGRSEVEVNAIGRVIRELSRMEGQPGDEVHLAIDMELQSLAYRRLGEESGAVVVMDVHSGEVIVLASTPGFDPNAFNTGVSQDYWQELLANERAPLTNKAIAGQYAPGSTFKPVVALAALEARVIQPDHTAFCKGHVQLGNVRFHCWKRRGHGTLDLIGALQQSCDVYFYDVARRVGVDRISAMAQKLGLGTASGIELPGEKEGVMPTRGWKLAVIGTPWQLGETLVTGIGQGFVLATPLQLAVMTARIANGRRAVTPHLTQAVEPPGAHYREAPPGAHTQEAPPGAQYGKAPSGAHDQEGPAAAGIREEGAPPAAPLRETAAGAAPDAAGAASGFAPLGISEAAIDAIRRGMYAVSNTPRGTAYRTRIKEKGMEIAGKTGTSQVRRITLAERERGVRKNEDLPWRERDHALFIAYAPADAPRYAIVVVVEHGGGGSSAAAPVAHDVMKATLERDPSRRRAGQREARARTGTAAPERGSN